MSDNFLMDFLRHRKDGEVRGFLIIQKMLEVGGWRNRTVLRKSLPRMINQSGRNKGKSIERKRLTGWEWIAGNQGLPGPGLALWIVTTVDTTISSLVTTFILTNFKLKLTLTNILDFSQIEILTSQKNIINSQCYSNFFPADSFYFK